MDNIEFTVQEGQEVKLFISKELTLLISMTNGVITVKKIEPQKGPE